MITDEEYEIALNNDANIKIMNMVCRIFQKQLSQDVLENCKLHGLYCCLQSHIDGMGNTFQSSLFTHVKWQCLQAIRNNRSICCSLNVDIPSQEAMLTGIIVEDLLDKLSDRDSSIVRDKYMNDMTFDEIARKYGCSKSGAKFIVDKSIEFLRKEKNGV